MGSPVQRAGEIKVQPARAAALSGALQTLLVMGSTILLYYVAGRGLAAPSDYMAFNAAYGAVSSALYPWAAWLFPGQR